eukprot:GHUV01025579.1.p1 GENE.GHUV01025579.1~~GHUV01025579.1.p1  ORF type:complete len:256 (+),score=14.52 GHUV01025579.1:368-1135(+)
MHINWSDFKSFFAKNPSAVYPGPKPGTLPDTAHAVICHGYNNDKEYWVCQNSWGSKFGVQGSFKIKFGVSNLMVDGQTYGISWSPKDKTKVASMVESIEGQPSCYSYAARSGDSISAIAMRMWGIPVDHPEKPIQRLLQDNSYVITNLEEPVVGKSLKVCKPRPEAILTSEQPWEDTGKCTASQLTFGDMQFGATTIIGGFLVENEDECCRLCAATSGCQFWWWVSYVHDMLLRWPEWLWLCGMDYYYYAAPAGG